MMRPTLDSLNDAVLARLQSLTALRGWRISRWMDAPESLASELRDDLTARTARMLYLRMPYLVGLDDSGNEIVQMELVLRVSRLAPPSTRSDLDWLDYLESQLRDWWPDGWARPLSLPEQYPRRLVDDGHDSGVREYRLRFNVQRV